MEIWHMYTLLHTHPHGDLTHLQITTYPNTWRLDPCVHITTYLPSWRLTPCIHITTYTPTWRLDPWVYITYLLTWRLDPCVHISTYARASILDPGVHIITYPTTCRLEPSLHITTYTPTWRLDPHVHITTCQPICRLDVLLLLLNSQLPLLSMGSSGSCWQILFLLSSEGRKLHVALFMSTLQQHSEVFQSVITTGFLRNILHNYLVVSDFPGGNRAGRHFLLYRTTTIDSSQLRTYLKGIGKLETWSCSLRRDSITQ